MSQKHADRQKVNQQKPESKAIQQKEGKTMSPPPFQLKSDANSKSGMPDEVQAKMENSLGADFSGVDIHENSSSAKDMGALAYTQGDSVHFAPGQFKPDTQSGQELIGHELSHVVQQREGRVEANTEKNGMPVNNDKGLEGEADRMGAKAARGESTGLGGGGATQMKANAPVQGYFLDNPEAESPFRVAEDMSVAVKQDGRKHIMYAEKGKVDSANKQLAGTGAAIRLYEAGGDREFSNGKGKTTKLQQVLPSNSKNGTKGDKMELWADCGRASSEISGSLSRKAKYNKLDGSQAVSNETDPFKMKMEIFRHAWDYMKAAPEFAGDKQMQRYVKKWEGYLKTLDKLAAEFHAEADPKKKKRIEKRWKRYYDKMTNLYYRIPQARREDLDKRLGINKYAEAAVGDSYTISSGGRAHAGKQEDTWNFHWGGVVLKSNDGQDTVTLENYSVSDWDKANDDWEFQLYGPASKKGQTFHEQHADTKQHGISPTTMATSRA